MKKDHLQLVHEEVIYDPVLSTSRLDRLFIQLRLKQLSNSSEEQQLPYDEAVVRAHSFLCYNYQPSDQIVLVANCRYAGGHLIKLLEILSQHLHYGTAPTEQFTLRPQNGGNIVGRQIPIHGVAISFGLITNNISSLNDQLKSGFPPGTGHIICSVGSNDNCLSCLTRCDDNGPIIRREVCFYSNQTPYSAIFISATKDFIHYKPEKIPNWDKQEPVWTQVLNSSLHGTPEKLSSDLVLPVGMYRHELRKYECFMQWGCYFHHFDVLAWKSYAH
ncbi:hypothetical protein OPQ81_003294 [Rhizoctonia solani]|nr:hypothetical protein OPQ81_003294 [Rhizoctonia solani]